MGRKLLALLLVFSLAALAGCGALQSVREKLPGGDGAPKDVAPSGPAPGEAGTGQLAGTAPTPGGATTKVTLYFADPSGQYLVPVTREIAKVEGIARATLQELILGPESGSDLLPTIPVGSVLRDINIRPDG
ncbi:MAG: GerMN domain-containing protein, partial [Clostridia bacterium]|nr:GerMN domain-containing protein [Clostridia bacterium]